MKTLSDYHSPLVIKLTLANLGQTGGIVGTIYAVSTTGSILGTCMTGFYFIVWFGTRSIIWLVAVILVISSILVWFSWKIPSRWKLSLSNLFYWVAVLIVIVTFGVLFQFRETWQNKNAQESNYYTITVSDTYGGVKVLTLDRLIHSYVKLDDPKFLQYEYLKIFVEMVQYLYEDNLQPAPRLLHLGGGGYSFPRYMEAVYPASFNEVVEIDALVTQTNYEKLGLRRTTSIKTYNMDARLFLIQRNIAEKYDIVIGDVFNDWSTPYHLTTLEFLKLVKANMTPDGIYMVNVIDDFWKGNYMRSLVYTLQHAFSNVFILSSSDDWSNLALGTFVIVATDRPIDLIDYEKFVTADGTRPAYGYPFGGEALQYYTGDRALLLTDDYAPTDVLIAPLIRLR